MKANPFLKYCNQKFIVLKISGPDFYSGLFPFLGLSVGEILKPEYLV